MSSLNSTSDNLPERLRDRVCNIDDYNLMREAADEIERLGNGWVADMQRVEANYTPNHEVDALRSLLRHVAEVVSIRPAECDECRAVVDAAAPSRSA